MVDVFASRRVYFPILSGNDGNLRYRSSRIYQYEEQKSNED
jgi:hypothetical protein